MVAKGCLHEVGWDCMVLRVSFLYLPFWNHRYDHRNQPSQKEELIHSVFTGERMSKEGEED
jgi:hypothetical protein